MKFIKEQDCQVKIVLPEIIYNDIFYIVDKFDQEVGFLGKVKVKDNSYTITELFIPEQEVNHSVTDITEAGLSQLALELGDTSDLLFWGHSHVNMSVTPSDRDDATALLFSNNPFLIRGIFNKRKEYRFDVFHFSDNILYEPRDISVNFPVKVSKDWDKILKEKVKSKIHLPYANLKYKGWRKKDIEDYHKELEDFDKYFDFK